MKENKRENKIEDLKTLAAMKEVNAVGRKVDRILDGEEDASRLLEDNEYFYTGIDREKMARFLELKRLCRKLCHKHSEKMKFAETLEPNNTNANGIVILHVATPVRFSGKNFAEVLNVLAHSDDAHPIRFGRGIVRVCLSVKNIFYDEKGTAKRADTPDEKHVSGQKGKRESAVNDPGSGSGAQIPADRTERFTMLKRLCRCMSDHDDYCSFKVVHVQEPQDVAHDGTVTVLSACSTFFLAPQHRAIVDILRYADAAELTMYGENAYRYVFSVTGKASRLKDGQSPVERKLALLLSGSADIRIQWENLLRCTPGMDWDGIRTLLKEEAPGVTAELLSETDTRWDVALYYKGKPIPKAPFGGFFSKTAMTVTANRTLLFGNLLWWLTREYRQSGAAFEKLKELFPLLDKRHHEDDGYYAVDDEDIEDADDFDDFDDLDDLDDLDDFDDFDDLGDI